MSGDPRTKLTPTTSQTVGPFFTICLDRLCCQDLPSSNTAGERVEIRGRVLDGDGAPVDDAVLEIWQANSQGKYAHPEDFQDKPVEDDFRGYGRCATDENGNFRFATIKPGPVPGPDGKFQAPHIVVSVFMRGLLRRLVTRIYFPNEPANDEDFALNLVETERRRTLIARTVQGKMDVLEWNVMLQGPSETVFFDTGL
jgi:protocatechuate 3,4-dioxygenase, alpha subunit